MATSDGDGAHIIDKEMKQQIINMDKTRLSLDGSNSNRGGHPTITYQDVCFPQLGKATSKSALTTMMISRSNNAGEPIVPHFQFQTQVQSDEKEAICVECIRYMLEVKATFEHAAEQHSPVLSGLNNKGGMDDANFLVSPNTNHEAIPQFCSHERKVGHHQI